MQSYEHTTSWFIAVRSFFAESPNALKPALPIIWQSVNPQAEATKLPRVPLFLGVDVNI